MRKLWLTLLLCATGLALASRAHATVTVDMRDGSMVRGTLVDVEVQFVTLRTPAGDRSIDLAAVKRIVTADGTVVYQGHAIQATPTPLQAPSPGPALPALGPQPSPAPTIVLAPRDLAPGPAGVPASAPASTSVSTSTEPAPASAAPAAEAPSTPAPAGPGRITRRHWGLALSWSGGLLAAAGTALTLAAVNQVDGDAKNSLGSAAAITGGVGLAGIVAGALVLPDDATGPGAALLDCNGRQLSLGFPALGLAFGGPSARLLHAMF